MTEFGDRLAARVDAVGNAACVGIDPHLDRLPEPVLGDGPVAAARAFGLAVVDAIADRVACVKPQVAFFEALGHQGVEALEQIVHLARDRGLIVILDAKRGDIGSTARAYVRATLSDEGPLGADAVTVSPYLGPESLQPFVEASRTGKGIFVLVRTSNPGSRSWQLGGSQPIADEVSAWIRTTNSDRGDRFGPAGAVIGATIPDDPVRWRAAMPRSWFLVPGYGAQGAGVDALRPFFKGGMGAVVNSSRGVLFPSSGRAGANWLEGVVDRADALVSAVRTAAAAG